MAAAIVASQSSDSGRRSKAPSCSAQKPVPKALPREILPFPIVLHRERVLRLAAARECWRTGLALPQYPIEVKAAVLQILYCTGLPAGQQAGHRQIGKGDGFGIGGRVRGDTVAREREV